MIDKIRACPFCGEKFPEIRSTFNGGAYVRCPDCGARTANFYNTVEYVPLSTAEWRAVADLLERQAIDSVKVEKALTLIKSTGLRDEIRDANDMYGEMKDYSLFEIAEGFSEISNLLVELRDLLESDEVTE